MTWFAPTLLLVHNPQHPHMHAALRSAGVAPGERALIEGEIAFFEATLAETETHLQAQTRDGAGHPSSAVRLP